MVLSLVQKSQIRQLAEQGKGHTAIAREVGVYYEQVKRYREKLARPNHKPDPTFRVIEHPQIDEINRKISQGCSLIKLAKRYKIEYNTLTNYVHNNRIKRPIRYFGTVEKDGIRYDIEGKLKDFADKHGLNITCLRNVLEGKQRIHRGFTNPDFNKVALLGVSQ